MLYGVVAFTLWHAPLYAWLLLVSGWARRMPVCLAALPFVAIGLVERVALNTTYFREWMRDRVMGAMPAAFDVPQTTRVPNSLIDRLDQLDPVKFAGTPPLDRPDRRHGLPRRGGEAAPFSRAALTCHERRLRAASPAGDSAVTRAVTA